MKKAGLIIPVVFTFLLVGCGEPETLIEPTVSAEPVFEVAAPGEYDSTDTAVITRISELNKTISFYNFELEKSYTLSYDSVTKFTDKYKSAISVSQLRVGEIADINFLKSGKLLTDVSESPTAFSYSGISGFSINTGAKLFEYKSESYKISGETVLLDGKRDLSLLDLDPNDSITITGFGSTIYGIVVDKGHGFLSLKGDDYFLDGFMEIDKNRIEKISPNMELILQEGDYDIKISKGTTVSEKHVSIKKDKKTVVDLSDIEIEERKTGKVLFAITPSDATLYVDNRLVDSTNLLVFDYGLHELTAKADGYKTATKYFNVGEESATLTLELEKESNDKEVSQKEEDKVIEGRYIFVTTPKSVEVFFDDNYIGLSPVSMVKKTGNHTITIKKSGYETKTYSVLIDDSDKDVYYGFDEMGIEIKSNTQGDVSSN